MNFKKYNRMRKNDKKYFGKKYSKYLPVKSDGKIKAVYSQLIKIKDKN